MFFWPREHICDDFVTLERSPIVCRIAYKYVHFCPFVLDRRETWKARASAQINRLSVIFQPIRLITYLVYTAQPFATVRTLLFRLNLRMHFQFVIPTVDSTGKWLGANFTYRPILPVVHNFYMFVQVVLAGKPLWARRAMERFVFLGYMRHIYMLHQTVLYRKFLTAMMTLVVSLFVRIVFFEIVGFQSTP
jgi:hypothetical protein